MSSKRNKPQRYEKKENDDDDDNKALQKAIQNSLLQQKKKSPKKKTPKKSADEDEDEEFMKNLQKGIKASLKEAEDNEEYMKNLQKGIKASLIESQKSRKRQVSPSSKNQKSPKKSKKQKSPMNDDDSNIMRLLNKGTSCFVNAALQLIDSLSFLPNTVVESTEHKTAKILLDLLHQRNNRNQLDRLLKQEDDYTKRKYYNGSQEDSGEFLMSMLDFLNKKYIHVSLNEITSFDECKGIVPEPANRDLPYINLYLMNEEIHDLQNLLDYEQQSTKLQKLTEKINGVGGCKFKKLTYIPYSTTRNIIIQLSRFGIGSMIDSKKNKQIITPNAILRFDNGSKFQLTGCIIHVGKNIANGHYTYLSFKKDGEPHQYIDDLGGSNYVQNYVKRTKNNYETNGYIYLYTKKD